MVGGRILRAQVLGVLLFFAAGVEAEELATRSVRLTYAVTIHDVSPEAEAVDLWLPIAQDTDGQVVSGYTVEYPEGGSVAVEPEYGNKIWHKRFVAPFDDDLHEGVLGARIVFDIHRVEIVVEEAKNLAPVSGTSTALAKYLEPNRLIPVDFAPIDAITGELETKSDPPIVAARKIYDWIIDEFDYDWMAEGAGEGDVRWACDSRSGDCNDYHSMFLALCRNVGIPADHEFGYPIRMRGTKGRIPSYHCWGRFHVEGLGWIPIDASEADKHPELREYNFGSQSANLFKFTHGRDVTLAPPQQGPPLNKFIHPYVEVDGVKHEAVKYRVYFEDIPGAE